MEPTQNSPFWSFSVIFAKNRFDNLEKVSTENMIRACSGKY